MKPPFRRRSRPPSVQLEKGFPLWSFCRRGTHSAVASEQEDQEEEEKEDPAVAAAGGVHMTISPPPPPSAAFPSRSQSYVAHARTSCTRHHYSQIVFRRKELESFVPKNGTEREREALSLSPLLLPSDPIITANDSSSSPLIELPPRDEKK